MLNLCKNNVIVSGLVAILCILTVTPITKGQSVDIDRIWFKTEKTYGAGILVDDPFDVGALVFGENITSVQVTSPAGITESFEEGPDYWYWDREDKYATLEALRLDFPIGNYTFVFNEGEADADSATVWIEPEEPTGFARITYPIHGATGVPLNPTFEWEPCSDYGDGLLATVLDLANDEDLYLNPLDIGETTWNPGPLPSGVLCELEISVETERVLDCETDNGDDFVVSDVFQWSNEITFTTKTPPSDLVDVDIDIKPETLNLKSKGVFTAFIELPAGYGEEDVDIDTVECEGAPAVKAMMADDNRLIVKFNREDLADVSPDEAVVFTVTGKFTDETPFAGSDTIKVIDKGDKK